ncbi:MAG: T9SS type A sorting domain-containing protein [Bacteroidota bacterium]
MKNYFRFLLVMLTLIIVITPSIAQYSDSTLNGQWLLHVVPITTVNAEADTNLFYIGFDANGHITDWENFAGASGTDYVTPSGAISVLLRIGNVSGSSKDTIQFSAQLTSQNYATLGPGAGLSRILNPGALTDSLVGVLNSPVAGQKNITFHLNSQGEIISATGLTPPVSGRVYADSGIFMGHLETGDSTIYTLDTLSSSWDEFTIIGSYVNDTLNGVLILDGPQNLDPLGTVNLVRMGIATVTGIAPIKTASVPESFSLFQNYPDPFNPSTIIQFTVPSNGHAVLKVFNVLGQEVATLFDGEAIAGTYHQVQFNASNLASGIYFGRLEFGGKMQMKKMLLLK